MDDAPKWNVPGWDWDRGDHAWLSSESGIYKDGTSIFFIHGGRIRHQAHIPYGLYAVEEFCSMIRERAAGLDDPKVCWSEDTGGGDQGFWVEGTRLPNDEDLARLQVARNDQALQDRADTDLANSLARGRADIAAGRVLPWRLVMWNLPRPLVWVLFHWIAPWTWGRKARRLAARSTQGGQG